jgi:hypothetical protein
VVGWSALAGVSSIATTRLAAAASEDDSSVNGLYRVTWSEKELIAAGTTRKYAHTNFGTQTIRLEDGFYAIRNATPANATRFFCRGPYTVTGKTLYLDFRVRGCMGELTATWARTKYGLRLHVLRATDPGDRVLFGAKLLKKIA